MIRRPPISTRTAPIVPYTTLFRSTAGTLGQIIPPSTLLIILSDVMSDAYQQAQYEKGLFTIDTISVGQTCAAALVPGLVLVAIYVAYMLLKAWLTPQSAPALAVPAARPGNIAVLHADRKSTRLNSSH